MPVILTDEEFAALAAKNGNSEAVANSTPKESKYQYKSAVPEGPITLDHGKAIVQWLYSKDISAFGGSPIDFGNGEAIEFDDQVLTWSLLATKVPRLDSAGNKIPGKNHYPYIFGLTDGEAVSVLNQIQDFPDRPKADKGNRNNSGYRRNSTQPAKPVAEALTADHLATLVAKMVEDKLAEFTEPAKPVPAVGHSQPQRTVKSVEVKDDRPVYRPGDPILVLVNGEAVERYLSDDSKRLNVTR